MENLSSERSPLTSTVNKLLVTNLCSVKCPFDLSSNACAKKPSWLEPPVYTERIMGKTEEPPEKRKKRQSKTPSGPAILCAGKAKRARALVCRFRAPPMPSSTCDVLPSSTCDVLPSSVFGSPSVSGYSSQSSFSAAFCSLPRVSRKLSLLQMENMAEERLQMENMAEERLQMENMAEERLQTKGLRPGLNYSQKARSSCTLDCAMNDVTVGDSCEVVDLKEMPVYEFGERRRTTSTESVFLGLEADDEFEHLKIQKGVEVLKMSFINSVAASLLHYPNFRDNMDPHRNKLIEFAEMISSFDPEFVLKVSLYARQELNIKSTANFLLAVSANIAKCKPYLKKYFASVIRLPSDWLEVANISITLNKNEGTHNFLPSALRKVMTSTFEKFDEYQLAKYNKKPKEKNKKKSPVDGNETSVSDLPRSDAKNFTLKQLIRTLHIKSPVEIVLGLLGKKYPEDDVSFKKSGLPGYWRPEKAGQRMKLATPDTWETMVSEKGNKAFVWESLIDNDKLPYMATLRNLKNLILCGISKNHHHKILKKISNKNAVINSRQFPLQFYLAYKSLLNMEDLLKPEVSPILPPTDGGQSTILPFWKVKQKAQMKNKAKDMDLDMLQKYKDSLSNALEISMHHNIDPIGGDTLVICDLLYPYHMVGKKLTFNEKAYQNCIMLGLMCLRACESCEMKVISRNGIEDIKYEEKSFLDNMSEICATYNSLLSDTHGVEDCFSSQKLRSILKECLSIGMLLNRKIDNIVLLLSNPNSGNTRINEVMKDFLHKYRHIANPELLYVQINIAGKVSKKIPSDSRKDVYLCGFSDHILKFLSENGHANQLSYLDSIDKKYDLTDLSFDALKIPRKDDDLLVPKSSTKLSWKHLKIFVSSTFKDMHGERDMLLRYVFPELRQRASSLNVNIIPIDLRWGVTEESSCLQHCLREARNCDIFIGLLGERYGTIVNEKLPDDPAFDWVKTYPAEASITELEIAAGALRRENEFLKSQAFFYFRDNSFESVVPDKYLSVFEAEDMVTQQKLSNLKASIQQSGASVYVGYPCNWGGLANGKPFVSDLEILGQIILDQLWTVVRKFHKEEIMDEWTEEYWNHLFQYEIHKNFVGKESNPMDSLLSVVKNKSGIFALIGKAGCGKSAFVANLYKHLNGYKVIPFFIGTTPRSTDLPFMLNFIANAITGESSTPLNFFDITKDVVSNFSMLLMEGGLSSCDPFVLLIDGLDKLDNDAQSLDWLPYNISSNIAVICTATESSTACKALYKRSSFGHPISFFPINPLTMEDRKLAVKSYLQQHGKSLDETSFNNQLIQLITKTDCGLPLYIHLACDYLIMFANFENLMNTIQRFPSTQQHVLEELLIQMENHHGSKIVQKGLILLSTVKEGLNESELHFLLSIASMDDVGPLTTLGNLAHTMSDFLPQKLLPTIKFYSFMHMIRIFVLRGYKKVEMKISSVEFMQVIKKAYVNKGFEKEVLYSHRLLAAYYAVICDQNFASSSNLDCSTASAFRSLPYHLSHGQCYEELEIILCSIPFLHHFFKFNSDDDIQDYYLILLNECKNRATTASAGNLNLAMLEDYYKFILRNHHIFTRCSSMIYQQARNEARNSSLCKVEGLKTSVLECLTREDVNSQLLTVNFMKKVTSVGADNFKAIAAAGDVDGQLKVFNSSTGKVLTSLKRHTSSITSVFFMLGDRICTASSDNLICLWSTIDFILLRVLRGHTKYISSCVADTHGKFILSSSWDCTVRFWSVQDETEVSTLDNFSCPVNCIAHHPELQEFSCGLWNKSIEIWNSLSLKRKLVLLGHSASVQNVSYSPDGLQIVSSSLGKEIIIWSSTHGLKIGHIRGHELPINSIAFCMWNNFFVTAGNDCTLKVWSNQNNPSLLTIDHSKFCPIHNMKIVSHNFLAVAFKNCEVTVFDLIDGHVITSVSNLKELPTCFSQYFAVQIERIPQHLAIFEDMLLFGTRNGDIKRIDLSAGTMALVGSLLSSITYMLHTTTFVFCGSENGDVGIFGVGFNGESESVVVKSAHNGSVTALGIKVKSAEKIWGVSASADGTIKLWQIKCGESFCLSAVQEFGNKQRDYITSCCILPMDYTDELDKLFFVTGSADNTIAVSKEDSLTVLKGLLSTIVNVWIVKDFIIGCGEDGSIGIWEKSGHLISKISSVLESATTVAFDLQSDQINIHDIDVILASVNSDGSISVKHPLQKSLLCTLNGHGKAVTSCSVNASGEIFSSSIDKTVNVWKCPNNDHPVVQHHVGSVTCVEINNSGEYAVTGDIFGNLVLWSINKNSADSPLTYHSYKKYEDAQICSVSWISDDRFACAINFYSKKKASSLKLFSIYEVKGTDETIPKSMIFTEDCDKRLTPEVKCMDYFPLLDVIGIGFTSGLLNIVATDLHTTLVLVSNEWILKIRGVRSGDDQGFRFAIAESNSTAKFFSLSSILSGDPKHIIKGKAEEESILLSEDKSKWITALGAHTEDKYYFGDSEGRLNIVDPFTKNIIVETAHTDAITDIHTIGLYYITCSLDKTIKIWNISTNKQVAHFIATAPVSCMAVSGSDDGNGSKFFHILFGTTVGELHVLKWMPQE